MISTRTVLTGGGFFVVVMIVIGVLASAPLCFAASIEKAGTLNVPPGSELFAFSTDPLVQRILTEDFAATKRAAGAGVSSPITISVSVTVQQLKPGVSLNQVAPGDPQVADLLKQAGATPPPIGDTGNEFDEGAFARREAERSMMPHDNPMQTLINQMQSPAEMGPPMPCSARSVMTPGCPPPAPEATPAPKPGSSNSVGDTQEYMQQGVRERMFSRKSQSEVYDRVVVARASSSASDSEVTVVAVAHPDEDIRDVKTHVAEVIANAILR